MLKLQKIYYICNKYFSSKPFIYDAGENIKLKYKSIWNYSWKTKDNDNSNHIRVTYNDMIISKINFKPKCNNNYFNVNDIYKLKEVVFADYKVKVTNEMIKFIKLMEEVRNISF